MKQFQNRLKEMMQITNTSAYKLSKVVGVTNQAALNWIDGTNEPKISYLRKICEYFEVSADYLLGIKGY